MSKEAEATCRAPGCTSPVTRAGGGKGLCARDYQRERRRKAGKGTLRAGGHVGVAKGAAVAIDTRIDGRLAELMPELARAEGLENPYRWLQVNVSKLIERKARAAGLL